MSDLGFKDRHVAALISGEKPFTLRRAWKNGRTPDLESRVGLVSGWRTPARRRFATAVVEFRCSVGFGETGFVEFTGWRASQMAGPWADLVRSCLRGDEDDRLARLDGFPDYATFWGFHSKHRADGADPIIRRELIGFGRVCEEFAGR